MGQTQTNEAGHSQTDLIMGKDHKFVDLRVKSQSMPASVFDGDDDSPSKEYSHLDLRPKKYMILRTQAGEQIVPCLDQVDESSILIRRKSQSPRSRKSPGPVSSLFSINQTLPKQDHSTPTSSIPHGNPRTLTSTGHTDTSMPPATDDSQQVCDAIDYADVDYELWSDEINVGLNKIRSPECVTVLSPALV